MFCPKCGSDNDDTFKFCRICGAPLAAKAAEGAKPAGPEAEPKKPEEPAASRAEKAAQAKPAGENPQGAPVYTSQPGFGSAQQSKGESMAQRAVRQIRSPFTLFTILLFTLGIVLTIVTFFQGGVQLDEAVIKLPEASIDFNLTPAVIVGVIIAQIPEILICIGMWLVYGSALRNKPGEIKTTGITIIKVLLIIGFVLVCIGAAVTVLAVIGINLGSFRFVEEVPGAGQVDLGSLAGVAGIIIIIILAAIIVLTILFFVKTLGTLNWTKAQLRNETSRRCPSKYVAVILFIIAGCTLISLAAAAGILSLAASIGLPKEYSDVALSILPAVSGSVICVVVEAAFYVMAGILILKLNKIRNS